MTCIPNAIATLDLFTLRSVCMQHRKAQIGLQAYAQTAGGAVHSTLKDLLQDQALLADTYCKVPV